MMRSILWLTVVIALAACGTAGDATTETPETTTSIPGAPTVGTAERSTIEEPPATTEPLDTSDKRPEAVDWPFGVPDVSGMDGRSAFCTIYGHLPYRWATDAIIPAQLWLDHARTASTVAPDEIGDPFAIMLDFWEKRMDWQFTGGDRPPFTDEMEKAERAVARWAVDNCELPQIPPTTPVSPGYSEFTCDFERRWLDEAYAEYFADFGTYATHLHLLETHTDVFIATDHIEIGAANNSGFETVIIPGGACDEG